MGSSRAVELFFLVLMVLGAALNAYSILQESMGVRNFYYFLDLEIAGLFLVLFGLIGDAIYSHF